MANLSKLIALKRRANSARPRLTWQFVLFAHNAQARANASRLGMRFVAKRSWDVGLAAQGESRPDHQARSGEHYLKDICQQL